MYVQEHKINVQKYKKILKLCEKEIEFVMSNKTILVQGEKLYLSFFEKDEFEIIGDFNNIIFK